ncbi:MAG TPA: nitroreductase, partial [Verrucomicrobiae bacterium]|nr:nitroreductase [Verrucomicrobiae bacterium]
QNWSEKMAEFPAWGSGGEKMQFLVRYAVLAPSKCNAQPWLFEICGDSMDLICDRSWAFHEIDPNCRQLILSCGAALLNLTIAARHFGCGLQVEPFPWPGDRYLLARVRLASSDLGNRAGAAQDASGVFRTNPPDSDELFAALSRRCTSRRRFQRRIPPDETLQALESAVNPYGAWMHLIRDEPQRKQIAQLVEAGDREQMANKPLRKELARWVHQPFGDSKDGFPVSRYGLPRPMLWLAPGLSLALRALDLGNVVGRRDRRLAQSAPLLAVLGTDQDTPLSWLAAGQALESLWLRAAACRLSLSVFSPPIEVPRVREELARITGRAGFPQALIRLGYGASARQSPRRPAEEVII